MKDYVKKLWEQKLIEELTREPILIRKFIPKYKGKNKLIIRFCHKFKIGKYVYPHGINNLNVGETINIKSLQYTEEASITTGNAYELFNDLVKKWTDE